MTDQSLFCPYCGAQQLKAEARFCLACGKPIPAPSRASEPAVRETGRLRRLSTWWLLPLLVVGVAALVLLTWAPARSGMAELLASIGPAASKSAGGGPDASAGAASSDASKDATLSAASVTPTETLTAKPTASPTVVLPPSATPQLSVASLPTATPPPSAKPPLGTATPADGNALCCRYRA